MATDLEADDGAVIALPGDAFVILDIPYGRWLRVDAQGRMTGVPGSRRLPSQVSAVTAAPDGSLVVAGGEKGDIVRLAPDGRLTTVLDAEAEHISADGLAVRPDGGILVADSGNHRVFLVHGGHVSTVAGTGADGNPAGDGGAATAAVIPSPRGVSTFPDGSFLIVAGNPYDGPARIRRVDAEGRIFTVAGGGRVDTLGRCLPGRPARSLRLTESADAVALPDGSYLLATADAVYRVAPSGRTEPVACSPGSARRTGRALYMDGAPAHRTALDLYDSLTGAAVTSDGGLLLATPTHVALVPPPAGGQRLGAALPAANLKRVPRGSVVVQLTHEADVVVSVARRGRRVATLRATCIQAAASCASLGGSSAGSTD